MPSYTVKAGDTLWGIAQRHLGNGARWQELGFKGDPRKLPIGTVLNWGAPAPSGGGGGGGGGAQSAYDNFVAEERRRIDEQLARQKAEQEGLFGQYEQKLGSQEKLQAMWDRIRKEGGIPDLEATISAGKGEIYKIKGLLDRLDEDITARTSGQNITEAQRRRLAAAEGEKMTTNMGRIMTGLEPIMDAYKSAVGEVGQRMQFAAADQERELDPLKMRINALGERFAREMSGYSEQRQLTLTNLLDKLERERFLADREWDLAQKLAAEEREFARQKTLASMQMQARASASAPSASAGRSTPIRSLPSAPQASPLRVVQPAATWNLVQPAAGGSGSGFNLQGGGGINLQGGGINLQGGGFRLQG